MKKILELAKNIATKAHNSQFRNDKKTTYIEHPKAVVKILKDIYPINYFPGYVTYKELIVAWLHDVIEDTKVTEIDLLKAGIPFDLVNFVRVLTQKKDETYLQYILRVKENKVATTIKLADLKHNSMTGTKSQNEKYNLAAYILRN